MKVYQIKDGLLIHTKTGEIIETSDNLDYLEILCELLNLIDSIIRFIG